MGVEGLWSLLEPVAQQINLYEFCVVEGTQRKLRGDRTLYIGVDANALISQCIAGSKSAGVYGSSGLQIFFFKLCKLSKYPVTWVFVFDGTQKPLFKRNTKVLSRPVNWLEPSKQLLKHFGCVVITAPGEAEAELAWMNSDGQIDIVLTTDSDALVFGASCVIRSVCDGTDTFLLYDAHAIENSVEVGLTSHGLKLYATLVGSDYGKGLRGCGLITAHAIARCSLGEALTSVWESTAQDNPAKFYEYLHEVWIHDLIRELRTNEHGALPSKRSAAAKQLWNHAELLSLFPLYFDPTTSRTIFGSQFRHQGLTKCLPDVEGISSFCKLQLGFADYTTLVKMLRNNLWEGVVSSSCLAGSLPYSIIEAVEKRRRTHLKWGISWCRLTIDESHLVQQAIRPYSQSKIAQGTEKVLVWVPMSIVPDSITVERLAQSRNVKGRDKTANTVRRKHVPKVRNGSGTRADPLLVD